MPREKAGSSKADQERRLNGRRVSGCTTTRTEHPALYRQNVDKFYSKSIQKAILERGSGRQGAGGADTVMSQAAQSTGHYRQTADCNERRF